MIGNPADRMSNGEMVPEASRSWPLPPRYDFFGTIGLLNTGNFDPTLRHEANGLWRTAHTREGAATVRLTVTAGEEAPEHTRKDGSPYGRYQ